MTTSTTDELAELEEARLEAVASRKAHADLAQARAEVEASRARLRGGKPAAEGPITYRKPPRAKLEKRRARAKAAKKTRAKARR